MKPIQSTLALAIFLCALTSARAADDSITTEGIVNAPAAEVWAAWTTPAGLRKWLAPQADIDLRIGGLMRANYNEKGTLDDAATIKNKILSFDPGRMLSIQVVQAPENFPFKQEVANMWTVLYFEALPEGKTRLKIVGLGFGSDEQSQKMKAFFERGNAHTLAKLQKHFDP